MCGFAGIYTTRHTLQPEMLEAMGNQIVHRGPDHQGVFLSASGHLGMVHQRLAIVDLDARANQPMASDCDNYVLVFNGEIYNHQALREDLKSEGQRFRSRSDTEVLLNAYRVWGTRCLSKLQGMFAFAIWDRQDGSLFMARDRLGIKPLYYTQLPDGFAFCSDLKAFQACDLVEKKIDRHSLWQYLFYNYVPQPRSVFEQIDKLLPGHFLKWDSRQGIRVNQYWDLESRPPTVCNAEDWVDEFRYRLHKSVTDRLMSDVPIGAFLSGGLDSSAIVSHVPAQDFQTFTIGFRHQTNTLDLERADELARFCNVDNVQTILDETALEAYGQFLQVLDEPFAESSVMALFCNFRIARDAGVKVILSGDGADEVLGGYSYLFRLLRWERLHKIPDFLIRGMAASSELALSRFSPASRVGKTRDIYIDRPLRAMQRDGIAARHELMISGDNVGDLLALGLRESDLDSTLRDDFLMESHRLAETSMSSELNQLLYAEVKVPLVNKHLAKIDKASMANSVEARVPFLDHELVELAFRMPDDVKANKRVMKMSLKGRVPPRILRDRKRGFNVPMHRWLNDYIVRDDWRNLWTDRFEDVGLASKDSIRKLVNQHRSRGKSNFYTLWSLHALRVWLDNNKFST